MRATEITFNKDVTFNGNSVKAGSYRVYAVPGADAFEIGLNSELGKWGYDEPDYSKDLFKTQWRLKVNYTGWTVNHLHEKNRMEVWV